MKNIDRTPNKAKGFLTNSSGSYVHFLEEFGFAYCIQEPWLIVDNNRDPFEWILCLSITMRDVAEVLEIVLPVLYEFDVSFSLINSSFQHNRINNHAFPAHLYGKPLIIYPNHSSQAVEISAIIHRKTAAFQALYLPNCIRLGAILYATKIEPVNNDLGLMINGKVYQLANTLLTIKSMSPFPSAMLMEDPKIRRFIRGRYLPVKLISSSHKGNIVKAFDVFRMNWLFVKQAATWAAEDNLGRQMIDRLKWQQNIAIALSDLINVPKVVDFVEQDGYSYLITEFVEGNSIDDLIKSQNVTAEFIIEIYIKAVMQLQKMHLAGYVHRDFTAKNILIDKKGLVWLTDLELAAELTDLEFTPFQSGTFGYMSRSQQNGETARISDDVFAAGALLYYIFSKEHPRLLCESSTSKMLKKIDGLDIEDAYKAVIRLCIIEERDNLDIGHVLTLLKSDELESMRSEDQKRLAIGVHRKSFYLILSTVLAALTTVAAIYLASDDANSKPSGFKRDFNFQNPILISEYKLPLDILSIAGEYKGDLYVGTSISGQYAKLLDATDLIERKDISSDSLLNSTLSKKVIVQVDSFGISIADGQRSTIFVKSHDSDNVKIIKTASPFTRAARVSSDKFIVRAFNRANQDQSFYSLTAHVPTFNNESQITEVFSDAGFSTSGFLRCINENRCVYVTRFANKIFVTDTALHVVDHGTTIDTISEYTLHSKKDVKGSIGTISSTQMPRIVNKAIEVTSKLIYVISMIKADNQLDSFYDNHISIDVYDLHANYLGSFTIPSQNIDRLRSVRVLNRDMYVLYPGLLQVFKLSGNVRLNNNPRS
ncbi:serine/threonine protein kinase [Sphingobacterium bambusae]|uniref:Serine/threonine protein kinase n=1 Tax=Sphingobacterium bambusae TaxID=662858 RepID=A0ABW6BKK1_9SPHI|nr:serine/threonine-protein kinase [Sphingobacterium bambusae]WPL49417.1 serine/threonine-protein kinase [Sphingobacterium bambusae]